MQKERPIGVAIISVLFWIGAAVLAMLGLLVIFLGANLADVLDEVDSDAGSSAFAVFLVIGLVILGFAVLDGAIALGLWRLQTWAWWVTVILMGLAVLADVAGLAATDGEMIYSSLVSLGFHGLILGYMLTTPVREVFEVSGGGYRPPVEVRCPNPSCRQLARPGDRYCPYCRAVLAGPPPPARLYCRNGQCRRELQPGWRYCPHCLTAAYPG
jgi:hypothetical protein